MSRLNPRALDALRQTLQSHIEAGRLPGAVGAIVQGTQGGQVQWLAALGQRDAASGDAMREDAIFRIIR